MSSCVKAKPQSRNRSTHIVRQRRETDIEGYSGCSDINQNSTSETGYKEHNNRTLSDCQLKD